MRSSPCPKHRKKGNEHEQDHYSRVHGGRDICGSCHANQNGTRKGQALVEAQTKADLSAYKAGEKTAQKVAAAHVAYARKAEGEAAKYLLYQGAFKLYARCGEYDLAADAIDAMKRDIKDLPPAVIAEIVGDELRYVSDDKAPRLAAMLKEAKGAAKGEKDGDDAASTGTARPRLRGSLLARRKNTRDDTLRKATENGITWTYDLVNGEVVLGAKNRTSIIPADTTGNLVIPDTIDGNPVRRIGFRAFCGCSRLTSVTIPKSVVSIEQDAFKGCTGFKSVFIPAGVTNIQFAAFCACAALASILVDPANSVYSSRNGMLCTKDGTRLVTGVNGNAEIPASVKSIDRASFFDFKSLTSATIPDGVLSICSQAFNGCAGLKKVVVPASVVKIEDYAFSGCDNLVSVTMLGEKPDSGKDVFGNGPKLTKIHVPANAKSWAGMKEWQGKKLVFDAKADAAK